MTMRQLLDHHDFGRVNWDDYEHMSWPVRWLHHRRDDEWEYGVKDNRGRKRVYDLRPGLVDEHVLQKALAAGIPVT